MSTLGVPGWAWPSAGRRPGAGGLVAHRGLQHLDLARNACAPRRSPAPAEPACARSPLEPKPPRWRTDGLDAAPSPATRCRRWLAAARAALLPKSALGLDALIDVIAPSRWTSTPVSGDAALAALPPTRRAGSKPFAVEGFNEQTQQWETPRRASATRFQAGVQLANRVGALNEIEFSEFVVKAQAFADAINGRPISPTCWRKWRAPASWTSSPATTTRSWASRCARAAPPGAPAMCSSTPRGWALWPVPCPGAWCCPPASPGLPPVLGLGFDTQAALAEDPAQSAIREVTLSLDVPRCTAASSPLCACAKWPSRWPRPWTACCHRRQRPGAAARWHGRDRRRPGAAVRHAGRARPVRRLAAGARLFS
jgi:hypothetical protein